MLFRSGQVPTESDVKKIQEEIDHRKLVVRKEAIEAVKEARAQGDLSENFEYYAAKKDKNRNESRIRYLENMLKLTQLGATILPASPGFYHKPASIDELVNFMVARILEDNRYAGTERFPAILSAVPRSAAQGVPHTGPDSPSAWRGPRCQGCIRPPAALLFLLL